MNKMENLLTTAGEECAEIQQAISKSLRFGIDNYNPCSPNQSNADDIMIEFYQLCATIEYLQNCKHLPIFTKEKVLIIKNNKIDNIKRFQALSKEIGTLE